jgi:hypothetical protein
MGSDTLVTIFLPTVRKGLTFKRRHILYRKVKSLNIIKFTPIQIQVETLRIPDHTRVYCRRNLSCYT